MNMPKSFMGSRADALMDIVILSLLVIIPIIYYSYRQVKIKRYKVHKRTQVWLGIVLAIVVYIFEMDLKSQGGIFEMVKGSRYEGTSFMNLSIYIHMFFSITTSIIWLLLIIFSLIKFPSDPNPNGFSKSHKFWGRLGMLDMVLTGLTGLELYIVGFVL